MIACETFRTFVSDSYVRMGQVPVQEVMESLIGSEHLRQLLQRPIGCRVARNMEVRQSSGAVMHHHKDVGRGDGHEEFASDDGLSVITQAGYPVPGSPGGVEGRATGE